MQLLFLKWFVSKGSLRSKSCPQAMFLTKLWGLSWSRSRLPVPGTGPIESRGPVDPKNPGKAHPYSLQAAKDCKATDRTTDKTEYFWDY